jgi:hypothetical protein
MPTQVNFTNLRSGNMTLLLSEGELNPWVDIHRTSTYSYRKPAWGNTRITEQINRRPTIV